MAGSLSRKRLGGAIACVAVAALGPVAPALVIAALLLAVLAVVIGAERMAEARRNARGAPSPLERVEEAAAGQTAE
jgi:hypothetical protein